MPQHVAARPGVGQATGPGSGRALARQRGVHRPGRNARDLRHDAALALDRTAQHFLGFARRGRRRRGDREGRSIRPGPPRRAARRPRTRGRTDARRAGRCPRRSEIDLRRARGAACVFGVVAADPPLRRSRLDRTRADARAVFRVSRCNDTHRRPDEPAPAADHAAPAGSAAAIAAGVLRAAIGALMSRQNPDMNRRTAYITRSSVCLPNAPVENDQVEAILGQVGERPSRARRVVQRSNGIRRRYYVIDPATGKPNYTNASLTATAVRGLVGDGFKLDDLACLVCGTSNPDQLMPNHAVMVHGELGAPVCEAVATAGVCLSGATALKYGWMSVMSGDARNAVVTGSETASLGLLAQNYDAESPNGAEVLEGRSELAFEKDFLRWMLSDGAGALLLEPEPRPGLNLRVEWVDIFSYAHLLPACMYGGAEKQANGK